MTTSAPDVAGGVETPNGGSLQRGVVLHREYEIICLAPEGFSTRKVPTIRQAMCQIEMLLETGATKVAIYRQTTEVQHNAELCGVAAKTKGTQ